MTEVATTSSSTPALPDDDWNVGLEDVEASDLSVPRINIVHTEGKFIIKNSGQTFDKLQCVMLGVIKQRIMWHAEVDEGDRPMCKSPDYEHGFPNSSDDQPKEKRFPWAKSNFKPEDWPENKPSNLNGLVTLPCSACAFKDWNKGDWKVPPCSEQHTYAIVFTPDDGDSWQPALLTFQKSGIKPSKNYISTYAQSRNPMFTRYTTISLDVSKRGTVVYSTPNFVAGDGTDPTRWGEYANMYRSIRDFVRQPPRNRDEDQADGAVTDDANVNEPSATTPSAEPKAEAKSAPTEAAAAPPTTAAAASSDDDDDLPF